MNFKLLTAVIAAAFVTVSGASWAQVAAGGNTVPKYGNVEASKKRSCQPWRWWKLGAELPRRGGVKE